MSTTPPSTTWKETVASDEETRFTRHAEALLNLQRARALKSSQTDRGLHAKGNGVEAELEILDNLPEYARAGLFAKPATYHVYVRYSNGAGRREHDSKADVRGVALKIVGVPGKKVIPGMEDAQTQDFLLIRTAAIPFRDADEFIAVVTAAGGSPALALPRMISRLGFGRTFGLIKQVTTGLKVPMFSVASTRYFSAAPVRCGDYAIHYALEPRTRQSETSIGGLTTDWLVDDLQKRLAKAPIVYDFRVQFYVDPQKTPIEDASVEWAESDSPFVTVGRLTIHQQDLTSAHCKRVSEYVEKLSFDPWHALEEHRPLGNIMRARNFAYRLSTKERAAVKEPDGSERFD